jgi:uncharacterized protein (UPF0261 family)
VERTVAILGTLDTKGVEYKFVKDRIEADGVSTLVIDVGVGGQPTFTPDICASEVAKAAGVDLNDLIKERDRGRSIAIICEGAAAIVKDLYQRGKFQGLISLGGSGGTSIGTAAMQALPTGVPKLMVSTMASGNTRPYMGTKDITMMPSVVDIAGINRLSRQILANAAGAIAGMVKVNVKAETESKPLVAATMFGVTTPCVTQARAILESAGYEVLVFHATGTGGRAMEGLIRDGFIKCVLDVTAAELADELVGGVLNAGPNRMEAAGELGIPQVIVPGALDMVNLGPPETVPDKFKGRRFYQHNPTVTITRTTGDENAQLGKIIAEKLNRAKGPTTVVIPKKGFSAYDSEGQPFYDTETDAAFVKSLKSNLGEQVKLIEMDNHINDEQFARTIANLLLDNME